MLNFGQNKLPSSGSDHKVAEGGMSFQNKLTVGIVLVGVFFMFLSFLGAVFVSAPTPRQFFIFRGIFAISAAAIAAAIPGLLSVDAKYSSLKVRATGAVAVFVVVWIINPPDLAN